jgi:sulfite exporter TauE/SafE
MCGPFVAFAAAGETGPPRRRTTALYHAGRLLAYVGLGVAAGSLGSGVEQLGVLAGVGRAAGILAGVLMIAWGLGTMRAVRGSQPRFHPPGFLQQTLSRVTRHAGGMSGNRRALITGVSTALLPCGWLYAFVAAAAGTGTPALGALVMAFFWTGTLPVMVTLGFGIQRVARPLGRSLPLVTASIVVVIGLLTIAGRLGPMGRHDLSPGMHVHADR